MKAHKQEMLCYSYERGHKVNGTYPVAGKTSSKQTTRKTTDRLSNPLLVSQI